MAKHFLLTLIPMLVSMSMIALCAIESAMAMIKVGS
mgnify:CR=1 FL=1